MAQPPITLAWTATRAGLVLDGALTISFQRFLRDGRARLDAAPASLGALEPCASRGGAFLIPLHPGEAVWLGVEGGPQWPALRAAATGRDLSDGRPAALAGAMSISCDPRAVLPGLPLAGGGFLPLAEPGLRLAFQPIGANGKAVALIVHAELVAVDDFAARTGRPPPAPAKPEHGYQGWRLP
ncbi:MAG TPA: hypothetical protein VGO55_14720 [Allosphingosinicella sp.]|nr:hypothetical protein [Allosphingosinicella sp.]